MKVKYIKEIGREPTEQEVEAIRQYGFNSKSKCLDCGRRTYYFNQCDKCNEQMIAYAKVQY